MAETTRSEEHTSELQSRRDLVCRLLLERKKLGRIPRIEVSIRNHVPEALACGEHETGYCTVSSCSLLCTPQTQSSTLFPYTTLFRSTLPWRRFRSPAL